MLKKLYYRFPLSDRDVQELFYQRGTLVSHETVREWYAGKSPSSTWKEGQTSRESGNYLRQTATVFESQV